MKKKIKKVVSEKEISKKVEKEIKSDDLFDAFIKGYGKDASEESKKLFSTIFPEYIKLTVEPVQIGYYERVAESAVQYAERLLEKHKTSLISDPAIIAYKLVYGYKDHGFVIDKEEAVSVFGDKTIKCNTAEYEIGNTIYNILSKIENLADILDYNFYFIGSLDSSPNFVKKRRK